MHKVPSIAHRPTRSVCMCVEGGRQGVRAREKMESDGGEGATAATSYVRVYVPERMVEWAAGMCCTVDGVLLFITY